MTLAPGLVTLTRSSLGPSQGREEQEHGDREQEAGPYSRKHRVPSPSCARRERWATRARGPTRPAFVTRHITERHWWIPLGSVSGAHHPKRKVAPEEPARGRSFPDPLQPPSPVAILLGPRRILRERDPQGKGAERNRPPRVAELRRSRPLGSARGAPGGSRGPGQPARPPPRPAIRRAGAGRARREVPSVP